jgi:type I restriction enzyme, S subunit
VNNSQLPKGYKLTEVGVIPEDWDTRNLVDISRKITDGDHITPKRASQGYYLLSARNILNGRIDVSDVDYVGTEEYQRMKQRCYPEAGEILISCSGTIGRVAIVPVDFECVLVRSVALAKISHELADGVFIQYWLQASQAQAQIFISVNQGAQPNLFLNHIKRLKCALPSLPEQRSIATALSDMDELLGGLDRLVTKKRNLKQATMQQLLTGKTRLPGFDGEWEVKKLGDLADIVMGQSPSSSNYNSKGDGLPLIQGNADISNRQTIKRVFTTQSTKLGKAGDILMSVRAPVGEISQATFDVCLGRGVCALRFPNGFLYHYLIFLEPTWSKHSKGSTFDSVNSSDINVVEISIPPDASEQIAIASILSDMDTEIAAIEQRRNKTRDLKQAMMQELLTGRIRLV